MSDDIKIEQMKGGYIIIVNGVKCFLSHRNDTPLVQNFIKIVESIMVGRV